MELIDFQNLSAAGLLACGLEDLTICYYWEH